MEQTIFSCGHNNWARTADTHMFMINCRWEEKNHDSSNDSLILTLKGSFGDLARFKLLVRTEPATESIDTVKKNADFPIYKKPVSYPPHVHDQTIDGKM